MSTDVHEQHLRTWLRYLSSAVSHQLATCSGPKRPVISQSIATNNAPSKESLRYRAEVQSQGNMERDENMLECRRKSGIHTATTRPGLSYYQTHRSEDSIRGKLSLVTSMLKVSLAPPLSGWLLSFHRSIMLSQERCVRKFTARLLQN